MRTLRRPSSATSTSADCDRSGVPDECEIADGILEDLDSNGIPDACEGAPFRRGDVNDDAQLTLLDGVNIIRYQLFGDDQPTCLDAANANGDARLDISDAIFILSFLFRGGPSLSPPGPPPGPCGPQPAEAPRRFGCESYGSCL